MWRFIEGVKPPAEKRKDVDRGQYFKEYDVKRARTFNSKWQIDHPWLEDSSEGSKVGADYLNIGCRHIREIEVEIER